MDVYDYDLSAGNGEVGLLRKDKQHLPESVIDSDVPNIVSHEISSYGAPSLENGGPVTRTRLKGGHPNRAADENNIPASTFLVQIPHYAYKPEKNKKCQVCGKHARTPSDLLRHMRVHTGERPFPCVACEKTFKCKRSQLTHQYLSHNIRDGLSDHRLNVLDHRKIKRSPKLAANPPMPGIVDPAAVLNAFAKKSEPSGNVDQDEDTEIVEGEDISNHNEARVDFSGLFDCPPEGDPGERFGDKNIQEPPPEPRESQANCRETAANKQASRIQGLKKKKRHGLKKLPILRIKTHKCTHCKRQFRSVYTLRYHLRSMHDEKVYLSPALESRLRKRRWIPPHVRLQKSKLGISGSLHHSKRENALKIKRSHEKTFPGVPNFPGKEQAEKLMSQAMPSFTNPINSHAGQDKHENAIDLQVNKDFSLEIKKEKVDSYEDEINNNVLNKDDAKTVMNASEGEIKQMPFFASTLPNNSSVNTSGVAAFTANSTSNANISNPFVLPPHIFFPSTPAVDEGLMNEKPISWESLQVTAESILISKLEAIHPGTQQKYVLYKCGLCGKAFASLRVICSHLAVHNDSIKEKDCEKCGASFKWSTELDSHLEIHQSNDRKFVATSPYLPSYYVNPFPIPVVPPGEQNVMSSTRLLPYPFFPMPQQVPPLMQPGFYPFFAAALQQPQVPSGDENAMRGNPTHSPTENNNQNSENFEDKNLVQGCTFQCKLCPKTFDRIFSLQRHERIHSGVKACFCKICGRGFSELRNLRHHIIRFHAESAQREPLPYRRRPNKIRSVSSSQKLVSFLKKTAVRILNSMGQNKMDPTGQTDEKDIPEPQQPNQKKEEPRTEPENLSINISTATPPQPEAATLNAMPQLIDATSHATTPLSPTRDLSEVPPPKLSPTPTTENNEESFPIKAEVPETKTVEVMQDPKRSLLGNRRKGRPFKLSTTSYNALNFATDDMLFPLSENIFLDKQHEALAENSLLKAAEILNGCMKTDFTFPHLNYFNVDPTPNEPIDMRNPNAKDKEAPKLEPEVNENQTNESQERSTTFPVENNIGTNIFDPIQQSTAAALKLPENFDTRCLFPCSYCHKSFNSLTDLNRHMSFHADIRPFKCPYCSYCSRTNSQLKVHMMRHEGIKHYMCQICNYNGVTQSDLNRHLKTRTHLLRSRNICACCGTGFHTRSLSDEHYKTCHLSSNNNNSNNQDQNSKNPQEPTPTVISKPPSSSNRNRMTRLKQFRMPEDKIKNEFYQKLCDLNNMGLSLGDFLQQNVAAMNLCNE